MPISVRRNSDGLVRTFPNMNTYTDVSELRETLRDNLPPKNNNRYRLVYQGQIMDSSRNLRYYGVRDNDIIEMQDTMNYPDGEN